VADAIPNSVDYYRDRELFERDLADNAQSDPIRKIHLNMAERYRQMIEELETFERSRPPGLPA